VPGQFATKLGLELLGVGGVVWLLAVGVFGVRRRPWIDACQFW
jgi:hypothetical protein